MCTFLSTFLSIFRHHVVFAFLKNDKIEKHEISMTRKTFYKSEFVLSVYKNTYCGKIKIKTSSSTYLSGVEVDKAVAPWLSLQRPGLMKQEVKLFHIAKLLQQLHQVIPAERERAQKGSRTTEKIEHMRGSNEEEYSSGPTLCTQNLL